MNLFFCLPPGRLRRGGGGGGGGGDHPHPFVSLAGKNLGCMSGDAAFWVSDAGGGWFFFPCALLFFLSFFFALGRRKVLLWMHLIGITPAPA